MNESQARARLQELRAAIHRHDRLYYVEARPEISDWDYDALYRELTALEDRFPGLVTPDSPSQRVGGQPLKEFRSVRHALPMLSLAKSDTLEGLRKFDVEIRRQLPGESVEYVLEPKIDGVSISVRYVKGALELGATRGNGVEGDDITANLRTLRCIPLRLHTERPPELLEVRGEAYIAIPDFDALNDRLREAGEEPFPNSRNATAGTLKQLDPRVVAGRPLSAVFYAVGENRGAGFATHAEALSALADLGLPTVQPHWVCASMDEVLARYEADIVAPRDGTGDLRARVPYELDGIVVKVNRLEQWRRIPAKAKTPGYAIVYKPEHWIKVATTTLRGITVQVGRTGVLTPVAELDPVFVQGSTISRATLHNEDEIRRKRIHIGDTVAVRKAGMVIPEVVEVVASRHAGGAAPFDLARHVNHRCPACGSTISRQKVSAGGKDEVAWRCDNVATCPAQRVRRIEFLAQRSALDIEGLGGVVAEKLVESGLAVEPLDLFALSLEALGALNLGTREAPRVFGVKNAARVIDALVRARTLSLARWLHALGIQNVGEITARQVARVHRDMAHVAGSPVLRDLLDLRARVEEARQTNPDSQENRKRSESAREELALRHRALNQTIEALVARLGEAGVGVTLKRREKRKTHTPPLLEVTTEIEPEAARSVVDFFSSEAGKRIVERMRSLAIDPRGGPDGDNAGLEQVFAGKTLVLTGTLDAMSRDEAAETIRRRGGNVTGTVSGKTDYVVAGKEPGSKLDRARALGVPVLTEEDFLGLLGGRRPRPAGRDSSQGELKF